MQSLETCACAVKIMICRVKAFPARRVIPPSSHRQRRRQSIQASRLLRRGWQWRRNLLHLEFACLLARASTSKLIRSHQDCWVSTFSTSITAKLQNPSGPRRRETKAILALSKFFPATPGQLGVPYLVVNGQPVDQPDNLLRTASWHSRSHACRRCPNVSIRLSLLTCTTFVRDCLLLEASSRSRFARHTRAHDLMPARWPHRMCQHIPSFCKRSSTMYIGLATGTLREATLLPVAVSLRVGVAIAG